MDSFWAKKKNEDNLKFVFEWIVSINTSHIHICSIARFMYLSFCITHGEKSILICV